MIRPQLAWQPGVRRKDRRHHRAGPDVVSALHHRSHRVADDQEYASFASLPPDLRDSSIAYISSIHSKLETLGYEVLPAGSCYPERCVAAFTASEVECLAILEHRRWLRERQKAGLALRHR